MSGSDYLSLGQTAFKLVKFTHTCHLLLAFRTRTTLANQVGYLVSVMTQPQIVSSPLHEW